MKKTAVFLAVIILIFYFSSVSFAADENTRKVFDALPRESRELLESFGITDSLSQSFADITAEKAIDTLFGLFRDGFGVSLKAAAGCMALLLVGSLFTSLMPENGSLPAMGKGIAVMSMMFSLVSVSADMLTRCCSSLLVTRDFMLTLIPVFAGIVSFSGNPALAVSFNSVVFGFAQIVSLLFEGAVPVLSGVMLAISAASSMNPLMKLDGISRTVTKGVNLAMAFVAGVFVAVLSVRGVIAGAADSVTIRGVRFLVGNAVPVVGSAVGDALNSIVAGLGLIKNTVGMLGIAGVTVINLPVLISVTVWKFILYFISVAADIAGCSEIKSFAESINGVLAVIIGAICFVSFVFIISIAILITISKR